MWSSASGKTRRGCKGIYFMLTPPWVYLMKGGCNPVVSTLGRWEGGVRALCYACSCPGFNGTGMWSSASGRRGRGFKGIMLCLLPP